MPSKYVIYTGAAPHRFKPLTKSGIIAWEEGCLKCPVCVKRRCVYKVYDHRGLDPRQMMDSIDNEGRSCRRCVQGCPTELIHKGIHPGYSAMGDAYWSPDIISRLWRQAESGKIPVSGGGYPGPFSGTGFDAMWTDMSEIVRPTRDGIHGREYISTAVDLGRTPRHLSFENKEGFKRQCPPLIDVPLPILLRVPDFGAFSERTIRGWVAAARRTGTLLALPTSRIVPEMEKSAPWLIPVLSRGSVPNDRVFPGTRFIEISPGDVSRKEIRDLCRAWESSALVSIRLPLSKGLEEDALSLARDGVSVIHLAGREDGMALDGSAIHIKEGIRRAHAALVEEGVRDEITLLASGGIAMAEHVAKSIICGADAVAVDLPILAALECRLCRRCTMGLECPVSIGEAPPDWVASRVVNLLGAWHNQLLEIMGAMGIRDVRRMRGELGRAMFFDELDISTFGSLGGEVKEGWELE